MCKHLVIKYSTYRKKTYYVSINQEFNFISRNIDKWILYLDTENGV